MLSFGRLLLRILLPSPFLLSYTPDVTNGTPYGSSKTHTPVIWL
jgi:hypothetical protein